MATENKSIDDIISMTDEEKHILGTKFMDFVGWHPTIPNDYTTQEQCEANKRLYGEILEAGSRKFLQEKIPEFNVDSPINTPPQAKDRIKNLGIIAMDLGQMCVELSKTGPFIAGYGNTELMTELQEKVATAAQFTDMLKKNLEELSVANEEKVQSSAQSKFRYEYHKNQLKEISGTNIDNMVNVCEKNNISTDSLYAESGAFQLEVSSKEVSIYALASYVRGGESPITKDMLDNIEKSINGIVPNAVVNNKAEFDRRKETFNDYMAGETDRKTREFQNTYLRYSTKSGEGLSTFYPDYKPEMTRGDGFAADVNTEALMVNRRWLRENESFYNQLKKINSANPFTKEMMGDGMRGLGTLTALVAMHDNPQIRYTDIWGNNFAEQKEAAGYKVMDAFLNINEHPEKMGELIAKAAKAAANINCKKEVLHALGLNEALSGEEAASAVMRNENKTKALAVMSAIGDFRSFSEKMLNNVVEGRFDKKTNFMDLYEVKDNLSNKSESKNPTVLDAGAALEVYESARDAMYANAQEEYKGMEVGRERLNAVFNNFEQYKQQMLQPSANLTIVPTVAAEKSLSVLVKNDSGIFAVPKEQLNQAIQTRYAAEKADAEINAEDKRYVNFTGVKGPGKTALESREAEIAREPEPPKQPRGIVRLFSKIGFFKQKKKDYNYFLKNLY